MESLGYLSTSDHMMLKFTIVGPKRDNSTTELVPDWTKANFEAMDREIGEMDWELAFREMSGTEQWDLFKSLSLMFQRKLEGRATSLYG